MKTKPTHTSKPQPVSNGVLMADAFMAIFGFKRVGNNKRLRRREKETPHES